MNDPEDFEGIEAYYHSRPFNPETTRVLWVLPRPYGALAYIHHQGAMYASVYVKPSMRGQGAYQKIYWESVWPQGHSILTQPACNLASYLEKQGIPHLVIAEWRPEQVAI